MHRSRRSGRPRSGRSLRGGPLIAVVFAGVTDDGAPIDQAQCRRLLDLPAEAGAPRRRQRDTLLGGVAARF
jgi:hypothetical protein